MPPLESNTIPEPIPLTGIDSNLFSRNILRVATDTTAELTFCTAAIISFSLTASILSYHVTRIDAAYLLTENAEACDDGEWKALRWCISARAVTNFCRRR